MGTLNQMAIASPSEFTLTDDYFAFIESMTGWLREQEDTAPVYISPETGWLYRFDLTAFLLDNNVPLEDHRIILRVNGLDSNQVLDETVTTLLIPQQETIRRMKSAYRTKLTAG